MCADCQAHCCIHAIAICQYCVLFILQVGGSSLHNPEHVAEEAKLLTFCVDTKVCT